MVRNLNTMKKQLLTFLAICSAVVAMAQIPENGLVAYYSFDNNITDEHTRNYKTLSVNNRETGYLLSETAKFGKSLLTTVSDNTDCLYKNDTTLQFKTSFTISTWIKITGTSKPSGWGTIVGNRRNQNQATYNNFMLTTNYNRGTGMRLHFYISDSLVESPDEIDSAWHHIVAVYNAGNAKLYVDGTLKRERTDLPTAINYAAPDTTLLTSMLQIGNVNGINNSSFNNIIDELALYNRALTTTEIQSLYNATSNDLILLRQQWKKIVDGTKNGVNEITAKNENFIGYIKGGQNFILDIPSNTINQEMYEPNNAAATNFHLSSNGRALIQNGSTDLYYYAGGLSYINISGNALTGTALNSTAAYKIGSQNQGVYKYVNNNWVDVDGTVSASKIAVANDETILLLNATGNPAISNGPNYAFNFNSSNIFTSVAIVNSNLAYATNDDGIIYKYTNNTWSIFNTLPAMSKIAAANDGTLFGISSGSVYRFEPLTTGVKENIIQLNFSVYPNPANSIVTINTQENIKEITMFNLLGEVVLTETVKNTINVSNINNGIYLLQVKTINGAIGTKKIIVNN